MQLRPQALQFGRLRRSEHQAPKGIVFPIVESERHHLVDGHDLGVAQRGREQRAEAFQPLLPVTTCSTSVGHQHRKVRLHGQIAVRPSALSALRADRSRHQRQRGRTLRQHLHLNARLRTRRGVECSRGHQFATGCPFGRQANLHHRRGLHTKVLSGDARRGDGIFPKEGRIGPRGLLSCRGGFRDHRLRLLQEATENGPQQRPLKGCPLASQDRIGSILAQAGRLGGEQHLEICSQSALLCHRCGRTPAGQQGSLGNGSLDGAASGFGFTEEMPDPWMAHPVGMGIASQDGRRNVTRKAPSLLGIRSIGQLEVHAGEIAGVVAIPRPHRQADHIAHTHGHRGQRPETHFLGTLRHTGGQRLARGSATEFHHPTHAVAALGVGVLHQALDLEGSRHRPPPSHNHATRRRRMHGDTVGPHQSRHPDLAI